MHRPRDEQAYDAKPISSIVDLQEASRMVRRVALLNDIVAPLLHALYQLVN